MIKKCVIGSLLVLLAGFGVGLAGNFYQRDNHESMMRGRIKNSSAVHDAGERNAQKASNHVPNPKAQEHAETEKRNVSSAGKDPKQEARLRKVQEYRKSDGFMLLKAKEKRLMVDRAYALLFARLKLPADAEATLRNSITELYMVPFDVSNARSVEPSKQTHADFIKLVNVMQQPIFQEIRQTLGEEKYKVFTAYNNSLPERDTLNQIISPLRGSASQLTEEQVEVLIAALAKENAAARMENNGFISPNEPTEAVRARYDAVLLAAKPSLNDNQYIALKSQFDAEIEIRYERYKLGSQFLIGN